MKCDDCGRWVERGLVGLILHAQDHHGSVDPRSQSKRDRERMLRTASDGWAS